MTRPEQPVPIRPAATVALVRDDPAGTGLQVLMLRRIAQMAFGPGRYVFPGGAVDAADAVAVTGVPAAWAELFSTDAAGLRGVVGAAVRETFEECGVLLAAAPGALPPAVAGAEWEAARIAVERRELTLAGLLRRQGLVVRPDLLAPLAHWITPPGGPRRFNTRFFVAARPAGQEPRLAGGEADDRVWVRPADALARLPLMRPTRAVLSDLARWPDVAACLAAPREIRVGRPVRPG